MLTIWRINENRGYWDQVNNRVLRSAKDGLRQIAIDSYGTSYLSYYYDGQATDENPTGIRQKVQKGAKILDLDNKKSSPLIGWRTARSGLALAFPLAGHGTVKQSIFDDNYTGKGKGLNRARTMHELQALLPIAQYPWLTVDNAETFFNEVIIRVSLNPNIYTGDQTRPFDTEYMKKYHDAHLKKYGFEKWSPFSDFDKFKAYYYFDPEKGKTQFHWTKMDINNYALLFTSDKVDGLALQKEELKQRLQTDQLPYSIPQPDYDYSDTSSYYADVRKTNRVTTGEVELVIVPKLDETKPRRFVDYHVIKKAVANGAFNPEVNNIIYRGNLYSNPANNTAFNRMWPIYNAQVIDQEGNPVDVPFKNLGYKATFFKADFWGREADNNNYYTKGYQNSRDSYPTLHFFTEVNTENDGLFVWQVPSTNPILEGRITLPYRTANSIHPQKLYHDDPFVAFLPAKFGTGIQFDRVLPVNSEVQEDLTTLLAAANTDEIRTQLLKDLQDKGFHEGETVEEVEGKEKRTPIPLSMERFDDYIDAPQRALPYVYKAEDLVPGGKYRPIVQTQTVNRYGQTLLTEKNYSSEQPSYTEQFDFSGRYGHVARTIELALPFEETELPDNFPMKEGQWVGKGHVLPFESVFFGARVFNPTETFTNSVRMDTAESGSTWMLTRVDGGFFPNTSSEFKENNRYGNRTRWTRLPDTFDMGITADMTDDQKSGKRNDAATSFTPNWQRNSDFGEYANKLVAFHMTERFDLDHIYTPPSNDYQMPFNPSTQEGSTDNTWYYAIYRRTPNAGFNAFNKPSMLLMGRDNSDLHNGHLPVPARLISEDGQNLTWDYWNQYAAYRHIAKTCHEKIFSKLDYEKAKGITEFNLSESTSPILAWVNRNYNLESLQFGPRIPYTPLSAEKEEAWFKGEDYFRHGSIYGLKDSEGKYLIASENVSTKDKVDYFFNNRIVSQDKLDEIRGGRHFDNYLWQHDGSESYTDFTYGYTDVKIQGERIKNYVGYDFRRHMLKRNLTEAIPYLRDNKALKLKDGHKPYVSSDGFSMIVKPADATKHAIALDGYTPIPHVDQQAYFTSKGYYHWGAKSPRQSHVLSNSWVEGNIFPSTGDGTLDSYYGKYYSGLMLNHIGQDKSNNPNIPDKYKNFRGSTAEYAVTIGEGVEIHDYWDKTQSYSNSIGYLNGGTREKTKFRTVIMGNDSGNAPTGTHSYYYRHLKAGNDLMQITPERPEPLTTTASYFLSFIFSQSKWQQSRALFEKALGVSDLTKVHLSSFSWYDADMVEDNLSRFGAQYTGSYTKLLNTGIFNDAYGAGPHKEDQIKVPNAFSVQDRTGLGSTRLLDKNIGTSLCMFPAAIIAGQTNTLLATSGNATAHLPAYFKQDDIHAYDVFSSRRPLIARVSEMQARSLHGYARVAHNHSVSTPDGTITQRDGGRYAVYANQVDVTNAFKLKNPMVTSTAFITRRLYEPFELIIPTRLKAGQTDWTKKENWVMVKGYENSNSYALMDQLVVTDERVKVNSTWCYKVTVPLMYRKPSNAFDLVNRLMGNDGFHQAAASLGWFDFLASDEPFLYSFHVADIGYLLYHAKDVAVENHRSNSGPEVKDYQVLDLGTASTEPYAGVYLFKGEEALATDETGKQSLTKGDERALLKAIGKELGISPLLLKVIYTGDLGTHQAEIHYSDEKMGIGIPMFAGKIRVNITGKPSSPLYAVDNRNQTYGSLNPSLSTSSEIVQWYKERTGG